MTSKILMLSTGVDLTILLPAFCLGHELFLLHGTLENRVSLHTLHCTLTTTSVSTLVDIKKYQH